ncbi:MAG TPA: dihydrofolate reductase family protein [Streptosporangiaceae bacterium]|jgi:dihydrofolate reductase
MGKLVVTEFITLDGVIEDPGGSEGGEHGGWSFRHHAPDGDAFKMTELQAADAQLLGRVTYEGFAAAWPAMEESTGEFGRKMNAMPKYVVSTTLTEASWKNTTIIANDVAAEVARVKGRYTGDILVAGSGKLTRTLAGHNLVDEYRLMVHPVVLGSGKRLFDGAPPADLELTESRKVGPYVLLLTYRPAARPASESSASDGVAADTANPE